MSIRQVNGKPAENLPKLQQTSIGASPSKDVSDSIFSLHYDCAHIAANTYNSLGKDKSLCANLGYRPLEQFFIANEQTGFHAMALEKNDTIVLAFAGTDMKGGLDYRDIVSNVQMGFASKPAQYDDAMNLYLKVLKLFWKIQVLLGKIFCLFLMPSVLQFLFLF